MRTDTATRLVRAAPDTLYRAFVDPEALMAWLPPEGTSGRLLPFDTRALRRAFAPHFLTDRMDQVHRVHRVRQAAKCGHEEAHLV